MNYYDQLNVRRDIELRQLERATSDEARARIKSRLDRLNALRADWQSKYNVPRPCGCVK